MIDLIESHLNLTTFTPSYVFFPLIYVPLNFDTLIIFRSICYLNEPSSSKIHITFRRFWGLGVYFQGLIERSRRDMSIRLFYWPVDQEIECKFSIKRRSSSSVGLFIHNSICISRIWTAVCTGKQALNASGDYADWVRWWRHDQLPIMIEKKMNE